MNSEQKRPEFPRPRRNPSSSAVNLRKTALNLRKTALKSRKTAGRPGNTARIHIYRKAGAVFRCIYSKRRNTRPKFAFGRPQIRISQPSKTVVNLRKTALNPRKTALKSRKDAGIPALLMEAQAEVT